VAQQLWVRKVEPDSLVGHCQQVVQVAHQLSLQDSEREHLAFDLIELAQGQEQEQAVLWVLLLTVALVLML
jgi:hypothetical protein